MTLTSLTNHNTKTERSHFMPGLCSCKLLYKSNTKFLFKTVYFLEFGRLPTSSYIVYDLTTSGHMDLESIHMLYIEYIYISIQHILFLCKKMQKTRIHIKLYVTHPVHVLIIKILSNKCTSRYNIHDIHKLLHVSAQRCHPQGGVTTNVYKPTCQNMFCSFL